MDEPEPDGSNAREQPRSSMFLAAVLRSGAEQAPVKVRNLSPNGAMVETSLSPVPGSRVHLIRGGLLAQGTVVWNADGKCGLRFASGLSVKAWLAAPAKAEQQRVDEIVALIKAGSMSPAVDTASPVTAHLPRTDLQIVDDLQAVMDLMQALEDDLASSPETVARHSAKLQNLDIAMQMVRAVAQELTTAQGGLSVNLAKLEDLRAACAQALSTR